MKIALLLAVLQSSAVATPAAAQDAATPVTAAPAAASPAPAAATEGEKICTLERTLGSNRSKRVCRSKAQIDSDREAAREAMSREQRR